MDQRQYEWALGELRRLESEPEPDRQYLDTLRREIAAHEEGEIQKGRPKP